MGTQRNRTTCVSWMCQILSVCVYSRTRIRFFSNVMAAYLSIFRSSGVLSVLMNMALSYGTRSHALIIPKNPLPPSIISRDSCTLSKPAIMVRVFLKAYVTPTPARINWKGKRLKAKSRTSIAFRCCWLRFEEATAEEEQEIVSPIDESITPPIKSQRHAQNPLNLIFNGIFST